ncbi:MAG: aminopeptidase [Desulfobacteraceae bacterium IS3]|nr:MAG: aminopeptidase [Desulfobacteraceae bacterium IS3]
MFTETQLNNYADVLLWGLKTARRKKFKKNDIVLIRYDKPALRLAEILYDKLIGMGMNPVQRVNLSPLMERSFYHKSRDSQLNFRVPGDEELYNNLSAGIYLIAPESMTHLSDVAPERIGKAAVSRKYLKEILDRREEEGAFSWTLCALPTQEQADHAKLPLDTYGEQIIRACFLDTDNPVGRWQHIYKQTASLKNWLTRLDVSYFHIQSEHTDLKIAPGSQRRWLGISGHNIPSFELFLSPDWRKTEGVYFSDQPSYRNGNYVEGIRLVFKKGKVVEMSAQKGENFLKQQLAIDSGANKVGEFSLTDRRFSRIDQFMANTLFDENFGGTYGNCHIALGSSYSDTFDGDPERLTKAMKRKLGLNDSALHWDLVNTEPKQVTAHLVGGGKIRIYEDGEFRNARGKFLYAG